MNKQQWQHIEELYLAAMEQPADERLTFIDQASLEDPEIREELKILLMCPDPPRDFLEKPALELLPMMFLAPGVVPPTSVLVACKRFIPLSVFRAAFVPVMSTPIKFP